MDILQHDTTVKVLYKIHKHIEENKYSPSIRELCKLVNLKSTSTVHAHVERLREQDYLTKKEANPRTLTLTIKAKKFIGFLERDQVKENKITIEISDKEYKILLAAKYCLDQNNFSFVNEFENILNKVYSD